MLDVLTRRNVSLRQDVRALHRALTAAVVPDELGMYRDRIVSLCDVVVALVDRNLAHLQLGQDDILEDVLSNTQQAARLVRLLSSRLAIPILRAAPSDRLCLRIIGWLHTAHPETASYPAASSDGFPAIWPFLDIAPIYFFPCVEQRGLLYLPLFFHEFGHLLYACHRSEMDELVENLRREIGQILVPASRRNDRHAKEQSARRQVIVDTWYSWTQELFCDAVGLALGGPCFLHAFSTYLSAMDRGDFYRPQVDLDRSAHPVTWLRIKSLVRRASAAGYEDIAPGIAEDWLTVAQTMGVTEDYHGFYNDAVAGIVTRTVDDMLVEASPRQCAVSEVTGNTWTSQTDGPVRLLNLAWREYRRDPNAYVDWETQQIDRFLD